MAGTPANIVGLLVYLLRGFGCATGRHNHLGFPGRIEAIDRTDILLGQCQRRSSGQGGGNNKFQFHELPLSSSNIEVSSEQGRTRFPLATKKWLCFLYNG